MKKIELPFESNFFVDYIGRSDSPHENSSIIIFRNNVFKDIQNDKKLDFHYEFHINKKQAFIRLDCHPYQYSNYKNKCKDDFLTLIGDERVKTRKNLAVKFKEEFSEYSLKKYFYNFLSLIKKELNMNDDLNTQIIAFINETYDKSISIIEKCL